MNATAHNLDCRRSWHQQAAEQARDFLDAVPVVFMLRLKESLKATSSDPLAIDKADVLERYLQGDDVMTLEVLALAWLIANEIGYCHHGNAVTVPSTKENPS